MLVSVDNPIVAGIALSIGFVLCSLGVLVMLLICEMTSKATPQPPPPVPDTRYENDESDQNNHYEFEGKM